jgi:hypothetical protein
MALSGRREVRVGEDIHGLKAHEVVSAPGTVRVGEKAVRMPKLAPLQHVTDGTGVGESGLLHLPLEILTKGRCGIFGEVVRFLLQH